MIIYTNKNTIINIDKNNYITDNDFYSDIHLHMFGIIMKEVNFTKYIQTFLLKDK